ncbi:MAG TPA: TauD/TfdA family dioxygenase [Steroidobacteraceae bacterium]|nr:TauD/TfdA family dioxygenase [Steroidobacteraceae bacterium]
MSQSLPSFRVSFTPHALTVHWPDGASSEFASLWLRDNCPVDRDAHSGQRLTDVVDLPEDPQIRSVVARADALIIEWERDSRPSSFELGWLSRHAWTRPASGAAARRLWLDGASKRASQDFAWTTLEEVRATPAARRDWLGRLLADGIAFLSGVPCEEDALLETAALIGRVAETNYGQVFDVRFVPQPENLAYSDVGLGLHTDNPYREPVPGFQALHVLAASPEGGASLFADGFAIAEQLRATAPEHFARLTHTAVGFHYRSKDAELYAERPLIQLSCGGQISAVHYNSRSIAPLRLPPPEMAPFYTAYRHFAALLREPRFQLRLHLSDGDLVAFDNQRILHGRTAFSSAKFRRHLRGCYLTRDSVCSEGALLQRNYPIAGSS